MELSARTPELADRMQGCGPGEVAGAVAALESLIAAAAPASPWRGHFEAGAVLPASRRP